MTSAAARRARAGWRRGRARRPPARAGARSHSSTESSGRGDRAREDREALVVRGELADLGAQRVRRDQLSPASSARNGRRACRRRAAPRHRRARRRGPARARGRRCRCRPAAAARARRRCRRRSSIRCRRRRRRRRGSSRRRRRDRRRRARAVVGEIRPKRFADGAAMPPPKAASSARATGCDGTRKPDAVLAAGDGVGDVRRARQDERQRAGPERGGQAARGIRHRARPVRDVGRLAPDARSPGDPPGGPSPRRSGAPRRRCRRPRPARRPSRSETRRARRRAAAAAARAIAVGGRRERSGRSSRRARAARRGACAGAGEQVKSARIQAFAQRPPARGAGARTTPAPRHAAQAARSSDERVSFHVGIGVGRPSGQGGGPDFGRRARRDSRARPDGAGRRRDAGLDRARRDGRRDHDRGEARLRPDRARHDPPHRLQRPRAALRCRRLRGDGLLRPAVARHRARRRSRLRRIPEPGRGRPGPDVRLRLRRDARADAVPDLLRAPAGAAAVGSAQGRPPAVAAPRRQVAGDRSLRGRQAGGDRHRRAVDAAPSRA